MNSVVVKLSAAVALVLAITIGLVGKRCPHLFLRIPNIGYIPWALTGNPIPPHFDASIYAKEYFHEWAKDGDCIFASGPKSGTVWVHNIIHLLKNDGNDDFEYLLSEHNGITEFLLYPEHSVEMRINETQAKREKAKSRPVPAMTHFSHVPVSKYLRYECTDTSQHQVSCYFTKSQGGGTIILFIRQQLFARISKNVGRISASLFIATGRSGPLH
jgi:hypothetical protein